MAWQTNASRVLNLVLPIKPYFFVLSLSLGLLLGIGLWTLSTPSPDFGSNLKSTTDDLPHWRQEPLKTEYDRNTSNRKLIELKLRSTPIPKAFATWNELSRGDDDER